MKIIRETRVPFAVKGGGHSANPGFSSTTGIHIAMRRFNKVSFYANNQTVDIGSGLIWDDVFSLTTSMSSEVGCPALVLADLYSVVVIHGNQINLASPSTIYWDMR
jgi:hypothetical protein